jgi:hypothetical protein
MCILKSERSVKVVCFEQRIGNQKWLAVRVEVGYYPQPLSVRSERATFTALGSRYS